MSPIHVFAKWTIIPGHLENVLMMLKELQAKTREEMGNLFFDIHQDNADPHTLVLFEGYKDASAQALHINSAHYISVVVEKIRPLLLERAVILTTPIEV
ncbi:MAG: antibiotic biosynthesis monooxygenase [Bacteroidetes bacterium]|nr:antibiotic biosynthesis monooxygenase [Bacteroidota bacterium]